MVVETEPGGDVADDQHPRTVPAGEQVAEEAADAVDGLLPALAAGVGRREVRHPVGVDLVARGAVELAVVALPQPPVEQHRRAGIAEREVDRLDGAVQVGAEHRRQPVVATPLAQLARLPSAQRGEPAGEPAGRDAGLVVQRGLVGLEDELQAHGDLPGLTPGRSMIRSTTRAVQPVW